VKSSINYSNYIGRYFKQNKDINHLVFKILGYDGRYFRAEQYYLALGYSVRQENCGYQVSFLDADNFEEITEKEFMGIVSLCDRPYIVKYDENDKPTFYNVDGKPIFKHMKKEDFKVTKKYMLGVSKNGISSFIYEKGSEYLKTFENYNQALEEKKKLGDYDDVFIYCTKIYMPKRLIQILFSILCNLKRLNLKE